MAKASGLSVSMVQRVWRAFGLQPIGWRRSNSRAIQTVAKVRNLVEFYVSAPEHAIVLCEDETSQI